MSLADRRHFSEPDGVVPTLRPLTAYLAERAGSTRPAFTHLDHASDRDGFRHTVTWAELARRVRAVAAEITRTTTPGQRVAVLAPQDLGYVTAFLGALHAGTIAVPLFAPEVSQHGGRLVNALADCAPEVWLTTEPAFDSVRALAEQQPVPMPKSILAVDRVDLAAGEGFSAPEVDLDAPAYLQYTSGSTRDPAGAVITHRAVVTNTWQGGSAYGVDDTWTCAGWIPFFHDMGLVQLLCLPVFSGAHSVFMTPFDFIMRPVRWLRQMSEHPNVFTAAPNFAFDYTARKVKEADRAGLDLANANVVINGSEPVRPDTIARFLAEFGPYGFRAEAHRPSYGLAEATVFVTNTRDEGPTITGFDRAALGADRGVTVPAGSPGAVDLVAAGRPHGQLVRIVHPRHRTLCAEDEVGEIWVHGPNVADGYWQQPERSAETFGATIEDPDADTPATGWLRTGDLGLCHDGLLYVTGRMKDLIIIDGKNHYPQDIEATVQDAHPAIRRDHVAAFAVSSPGQGEGAAVVAEYRRQADPTQVDEEEIVRAVRRAVSAEHDVRLRGVILVRPGGVPRTSSGKIARAATRRRYWDDQQRVDQQRDDQRRDDRGRRER
ncbi:fatty acid CoA ligase FadD32 [Amycolatopsis arida]|uniref:Fatty acid CoA ligase FadD32 n=1 Tax=Amycolatopsis arida TaxID=587909 RepID=A0A1I5KV21_9PSEU|nr:fatty acyl-AMP ligase [Amycolatopsis arida]TDX85848.1 fatty acid CoA ligase FadD32 [Amycolatopsis arida]SFO88778.1 fatty acid CoA ligase FadD32 [Amycolatopsis arida]